jgi:hypothetical protein
MNMYGHINETYDGMIIADEHVHRSFELYLKNKNSASYWLSPNGMVDVDTLSCGLVIWRQDSLTRPIHVRDDRYVTPVLLGAQFRENLDSNYCCISDARSARGYLPKGQNYSTAVTSSFLEEIDMSGR